MMRFFYPISFFVMEKQKHNYIKVGQDSATTHEFNSAKFLHVNV